MARAKGWIWISLALVCALAAGGLTYFLLQRQSAAAAQEVDRVIQEAAAAPKEETVSVPVAARNLERGTQLTADAYVLKEFPVSLAPTSAITDTELIADQILSQFVAQGDIFRQEAIYGGTSAVLSSAIEPGRTVIAFPAEDLLGGTGMLVEGDRVDLIITNMLVDRETDEELGEITGYTVQNVRIMRILSPAPTEDSPNPVPTSFLLELDPADALMVKAVKDIGGRLDLALRSPVDQDDFEQPPVTEDDIVRLLTRYGDSTTPPDTVGNAP